MEKRSLQARVNLRLVPSHLHSLKKLKTSTLYLILIKWFLSLSCFVEHLPRKLFMHKKVILLIHFTGTQLSFTWERVPSAWPGLGDSSQGSASSPGSQEASLEQKQESECGNSCIEGQKTENFPPPPKSNHLSHVYQVYRSELNDQRHQPKSRKRCCAPYR